MMACAAPCARLAGCAWRMPPAGLMGDASITSLGGPACVGA